MVLRTITSEGGVMKLVDREELDGWSQGDTRALISRLGGLPVAREINADRLVLRISKSATEVEPGEIALEEPVKPLFDSHGRFIPPQGLKAKVVDANRGFHLIQPEIDYSDRHTRLTLGFGIPEIGVVTGSFQDRTGAIMARLAQDPKTANLLSGGVCLPLVFPKMETSGDYGTLLEKRFLPAVGRTYEQQFPGRMFQNYRAGELAGKVTVVDKSHQRLLEAMATGWVVGLYFPQALQGFSIPADREVMAYLPEDFVLAGAIDMSTAMVAYPDVLGRDYQTPGLDCAGVQWRSRGRSLYFEAGGGELGVGSRSLFPCDDCSGGLARSRVVTLLGSLAFRLWILGKSGSDLDNKIAPALLFG